MYLIMTSRRDRLMVNFTLMAGDGTEDVPDLVGFAVMFPFITGLLWLITINMCSFSWWAPTTNPSSSMI